MCQRKHKTGSKIKFLRINYSRGEQKNRYVLLFIYPIGWGVVILRRPTKKQFSKLDRQEVWSERLPGLYT